MPLLILQISEEDIGTGVVPGPVFFNSCLVIANRSVTSPAIREGVNYNDE